MGCQLNREAYAKLIREDIIWLLKQPRSLEQEHIGAVLASLVQNEETRDSWKTMALELVKQAKKEGSLSVVGDLDDIHLMFDLDWNKPAAPKVRDVLDALKSIVAVVDDVERRGHALNDMAEIRDIAKRVIPKPPVYVDGNGKEVVL